MTLPREGAVEWCPAFPPRPPKGWRNAPPTWAGDGGPKPRPPKGWRNAPHHLGKGQGTYAPTTKGVEKCPAHLGMGSAQPTRLREGDAPPTIGAEKCPRPLGNWGGEWRPAYSVGERGTVPRLLQAQEGGGNAPPTWEGGGE
jgi:hypothetical protein